MNNFFSDKQPLKVGVPQGSVLGPLLFIIFINDLCHLKLNCDSFLFADDTTLSYASDSIQSLIETITIDLESISNWLKHNKLILNVMKTNAMFFSNGSRLNTNSSIEKIKVGGIGIPFVEKVKLLGVSIDNKLKFDIHTLEVCRKVSYKVKTLKRCCFMFSNSFKVTLFKLFIQSSFDYCSSLFFYLSNQTDSDRLDKSFAKALNVLLNIKLSKSKTVSTVVKDSENKYIKKTKIISSYLPIAEQLEVLNKIGLLPLKLRFFYRSVYFLYSNFKNNPNSNLILSILSHKKIKGSSRVSHFLMPNFNSNLYKFSFLSISIKFVNLFLFNYIFINSNINFFFKNFKNSLYLFNCYNLFLKSMNNWI